jgi:hypothetical protein
VEGEVRSSPNVVAQFLFGLRSEDNPRRSLRQEVEFSPREDAKKQVSQNHDLFLNRNEDKLDKLR